MRHLTLEALAGLVDEAPEGEDAAHLAACEECRHELDALRAQSDALGTLPKLMPPPDAWPALSRRLRAEGLTRRPAPARRAAGPVQIAAALALFVAGGATGFLARGPIEAAEPVASAEHGELGETGVDATERAAERASDLAGPEGGPGGSQDPDEMFAAALDRFMQASGTRAPDPAARLAALDNIVLTTAEALNESPGDPVINSYHLTAVAQRKELLRQLSASGREPVF